MNRRNKGFTLAELLIVVAIIAVLVAISIPMFSSQLEKSRESVDFVNVRSAYAQVMTAVMTEDTSSPLYNNGIYRMDVPLKQAQNGWTTKMDNMVIGGVAYTDTAHWLPRLPRAKGRCKVYYKDNAVYLDWGTEDHINTISAADFLTKEILQEIVSANYNHTVINSNEPYHQGEGTQKFIDYAKKNGFDLTTDYGAATWQIYAKSSDSNGILSNPAIYWSTIELNNDMIGKNVPVMGYRNGHYDVYFAPVEQYNNGTANEYLSIKNGFASVKEGDNGLGGSATFQFDSYDKAKAEYDKLLAIYNEKGTITGSDLSADLKK